jgi:dolichol-phosphate mannosyltransferase
MTGPTWIVLPTYCEAANVERMVDALRAALPDAHVLVVDDASPDGTGAIADRLASDPQIHVVHRAAKRGLGPAYLAGFDHALARGAGAVCQIDCDFSHDPAILPRLLDAVAAGADLALGSRYVAGGGVEGWVWWRRAVSRAGCAYARAVLRVPVRDLTGGMKCFRAEALEAIGFRTARSRGYAFQVELTYRALRAGLRVVELPITFRERREGQSKLTGHVALEAAWRIPALRLRGRAEGARSSC